VALVDGERLVTEYVLDISVTHSERLLAAVDRVLADARWTPRDLEGLAVSIGPGSFTGLRIGVSTVKGLGWALGLPIAAVPTLDAMAATVPWAALPVCPVLDARRGEVYASLYRRDGAGLRREWEYLALPPAELAGRLAPRVAIVVVGGAEDRELGETIVTAVRPYGGTAVNACGRLSLRESVALIGKAAALVTNDSAPLHFAAAAGTPIVALFGPTLPTFGFGPRGPRDVALGVEDLACRPCSRHGPTRCPLGHHHCMRRLALEPVLAALEETGALHRRD